MWQFRFDVMHHSVVQHNHTVRHLDLGRNKIEVLPYGFIHLGLKSLRLYKNPLKFPGKPFAKYEPDDIISFFGDLRKGSERVRHAKLMLVGHGRAGKSTLAKALNMGDAALRGLLQELKHKAGLVLYLLCVS